MKAIKWVLLALILIVIILVAISFFMPSSYRVERSIRIGAPVELIFSQVNTIENWQKCDPWGYTDPDIRYTYEGPSSGEGAIVSWESEVVGNGWFTIIESKKNESITNKIVLDEWGGERFQIIKFEQEDDSVKVTWVMEGDLGKNPFMKFMRSGMEKMISPDFVKGLKNLKELCEYMDITENMEVMGEDLEGEDKEEKVIDIPIIETTINSQKMISIREITTADSLGIVRKNLFGMLKSFIKKSRAELTGSPIIIYHYYSDDSVDMEVGIPINNDVKVNDPYKMTVSPSGQVIAAVHRGGYGNIRMTYDFLLGKIAEQKKTINGSSWEIYLSEEEQTPDSSQWITEIVFPVGKKKPLETGKPVNAKDTMLNKQPEKDKKPVQVKSPENSNAPMEVKEEQ